ncbi:flippase [Carboxylicivirga marina]|uniref:Flippase n=1 Tax=Carboxylicivirga marina TaxID=2800988 RepID=A0ABS1HK11_9BACT|nr:flippase [Carboxylicivirga marina]MBK3518007.1 flippase [Carboxylicivirga marina]
MLNNFRSIAKSKGFAKYFNNTSWLFVEKILRMSIGLIVGVWVARYLGPEEYGILSYSQSFVSIYAAIATLGLDSIVVRELVRDDSKRDILIGTAFRLRLIGAMSVLVLIITSILIISNDNDINLLVFTIACASIFQSFNVIDFYFRSKVLSKFVVYANIISLLLSSLVKVALILNEAPLITFGIAILFDSIILALGYIYFYWKHKLLIREWKYDNLLAKKMLKDSAPLIIAGVMNSIYMKIDQVMLKEMVGASKVGYYSVAVKFSEIWFSVGVIICNSLFPAIINAKNESEKLYYQRLQNLFSFLVIISYLAGISIFFISDWLILNLYGEEYILASAVLSIHFFSGVFVFLGVGSGRWLINENRTMINLYRNILAVVVNVLLNILLIKNYGIIGAAIASLTAYACAFYFYDFFFKETKRMAIMKSKALMLLKW